MKTTLLRARIAVIFLFVIGNNDLSAQILSVGSEQSLNIISGTTFSLDNVILIPTKNYVLQNNVFDSRNMITKFPNGNAMTKAYYFSEDPQPFSGIMEVRYKDYELNGLNPIKEIAKEMPLKANRCIQSCQKKLRLVIKMH